jgi:hypothetical protein
MTSPTDERAAAELRQLMIDHGIERIHMCGADPFSPKALPFTRLAVEHVIALESGDQDRRPA